MSTIKLNRTLNTSPNNHPVIFSALVLFQFIILYIIGKSNLVVIENFKGSLINLESISLLQLLGVIILTEIFSNLIQKKRLNRRHWLRKFVNIIVSFTVFTVAGLLLSFTVTSPMVVMALFIFSLLTSLIATTYTYVLLAMVN